MSVGQVKTNARTHARTRTHTHVLFSSSSSVVKNDKNEIGYISKFNKSFRTKFGLICKVRNCQRRVKVVSWNSCLLINIPYFILRSQKCDFSRYPLFEAQKYSFLTIQLFRWASNVPLFTSTATINQEAAVRGLKASYFFRSPPSTALTLGGLNHPRWCRDSNLRQLAPLPILECFRKIDCRPTKNSVKFHRNWFVDLLIRFFS